MLLELDANTLIIVVDDATKVVNAATKLVVNVKLDQGKDHLPKRNLTGNELPQVH